MKETATVKSLLAEPVPFKQLDRLYQATDPIDAIAMGYRRTWTSSRRPMSRSTRLIGGLISPKNLMGPVGIITLSYRIVAQQPLVNYAYFLGLISATIAVINFLPMPPFDGGLIVLMLIEKVKGSALTERTQGIVAYAGWVLVLVLLVYVTFNDIVRSFFSIKRRSLPIKNSTRIQERHRTCGPREADRTYASCTDTTKVMCRNRRKDLKVYACWWRITPARCLRTSISRFTRSSSRPPRRR